MSTAVQLALFDLTLFDTRCPKCGHRFNALEDQALTSEQERRIREILHHPRVQKLPSTLRLFLKTSPPDFLLGYTVGVTLWETERLYNRATAYRHLRKLAEYQLVAAIPTGPKRHQYRLTLQLPKKQQSETTI